MKITVTKEVEVKIEFPAYYQWGYCFYKLNSEKEYVEVNASEREPGITLRETVSDVLVAQIITSGKHSNQYEFLGAFEKVFDKLNMIYATVNPSHPFNQQPEEENGLSESERNEEQVNQHFEIELSNQE